MRLTAVALILALAGCADPAPKRKQVVPGDRLERAATAAGLVADPAVASLAGVYADDADRICIVPRRDGGNVFGVTVDYGEGQRCLGQGSAVRSGNRLDVRLGDCRVGARFDGQRVRFPVDLPDACRVLCRGRASLAALDVPKLSDAVSEAVSMRDAAGRLVCLG